MKIGTCFFINNALIFNACPLSEGRKQADKIDNSYGYDEFYYAHFKSGDIILTIQDGGLYEIVVTIKL